MTLVQHLRVTDGYSSDTVLERVQLIAAMSKYEASKVSYVDRLRQQHVKQASRADVLGFAREVQSAVTSGRLDALVERARKAAAARGRV